MELSGVIFHIYLQVLVRYIVGKHPVLDAKTFPNLKFPTPKVT